MPDMPIDFSPYGSKKVSKKTTHKKHRPSSQGKVTRRKTQSESHKSSLTPQQAAEKVMGYVHPYAVTALFMVALFFGFVGGWIVMSQPGTRGVGILISIILIWAAKYPIKAWATWSANAENREEYIQKQLEKELGSSDSTSNELSEDDFDPTTLSILKKTIKKARKDKAQVTVPFLLKELASNIR
jgi:hypothetical protein